MPDSDPARRPAPRGSEPVPRWSPWAAAAAAFALYAALAPRATGLGDAGEFTLVLAVGGVPHPSGYPLYTLLGSAFVHLLRPLGFGWAHAANLWSALGAALAAGLFVRLGARLAARAAAPAAWRPALAAAFAALVLHPRMLEAALVAEVYSWHLAWIAWGSLVAFDALDAAERGAAGPPGGLAARWGAVVGVGLAHHLTSLFVALPLGVALAPALFRRGGRRAAIAGGAAALLLPLVAYGWIAWRQSSPAAYQWALLGRTPADLWAHVSGGIYSAAYVRGPALSDSPGGALAGIGAPFALLVAGALVALPIVTGDRARRRFGVAIAAAALLQCGFALAYAVPDPAAYALPILLLGLIALPAALAALPSRGAAMIAAGAFAALVAISLPGWTRATGEWLERTAAVDARIRATWLAIPFERGIVLWADDHFVRLRAYQVLDHERPGLVVENPKLLTWEPVRAAFRERTGVDPLAGLALRDDRDLARVADNIRRRTTLPVIEFDRFAAER